jgi:hypothetical protein
MSTLSECRKKVSIIYIPGMKSFKKLNAAAIFELIKWSARIVAGPRQGVEVNYCHRISLSTSARKVSRRNNNNFLETAAQSQRSRVDDRGGLIYGRLPTRKTKIYVLVYRL